MSREEAMLDLRSEQEPQDSTELVT